MKKITTHSHKDLSSTPVEPLAVMLKVVSGFVLVLTMGILAPSHALAWDCALSASSATINEGSSATLSWATINSTSFSIDNGVGAVSSVNAGSTTVSPTVTTTYTGTAVGTEGSITCEVTVFVTAKTSPPAPPTCTLSTSSVSIQKGSSSALSWTTANATSFSINQGVGAVTSAVSGSESVSPTATTTYTGTATGPGGSVTCSTTVTVTTPPPPTCHTYSLAKDGKITGSDNKDIATLTIPANVCPVEVSFSSYNLPDGKILPYSHQVLYDNITNTYGPGTHTIGPLKLACNWQTDLYLGGVQTTLGSSGTQGLIAYDDLTGKTCVSPPPAAPSCTLSANPTTIQNGSSSVLSWTTTKATSFVLDNNIGTSTPVASSSISVSPTTTTTYTGTATGPGGSATCSTTVKVTATPPPPAAPSCTLSANPTTIQNGSSSVLSWTTTKATSFVLDNNIGTSTPVASSSISVSPTTTTTYTGTATGPGGSATCSTTVKVTATPPPPAAPSCTLSANPTTIQNGSSSVLSWTTTKATSFVLDNNIGTSTPVASSSISVSPTTTTTYTGTATGPGGSAICPATVTVTTTPPPSGCTSSCGGGGGGGGGSSPLPYISLTSLPHIGSQPLAYLSLSQIPYTGLDLGPVGTVVYWVVLIAVALTLAYLVLFWIVPLVDRSIRGLGSSIKEALNAQEPAYAYGHIAQATMPELIAPQVKTEEEPYEVPRSYSSYEGFRSFAHNGVLSIDDIVNGLAHSHPAPSATIEKKAEPVHGPVEPIYENIETIMNDTAPETVPSPIAPTYARGFIAALIEGDRPAVFAGLRQYVRGAGTPEKLMSETACLLDDAYRARVDGTSSDADIARLVARLDTPTLEKLVASLTTAIDSSYTISVTGAKLALTRALAVVGAQ